MKVWLENLKSIHHKIMAKYLRKRGWVVFYLDEPFRICSDKNGVCWMKIYNSEQLGEK